MVGLGFTDTFFLMFHSEACGVCSSAADLWVHIQRLNTLEDDTVACATAYTFNQNLNGRFDTLVSCFTAMGFSEQCSVLAAHYSATNAGDCANVCIPDTSGNIVLNEAPPACALGPCLSCSANFTVAFDIIGGRTLQGSGIVERIARPCSSIYPVNHDPCIGANSTILPPTSAPTSMQASNPSSGTIMTISLAFVLPLFGSLGLIGSCLFQ